MPATTLGHGRTRRHHRWLSRASVNCYKLNVDTITDGLTEQFSNLNLVGRNSMHKYNNQDHAIMTGIPTALNIIISAAIHDIWGVNEDAEYHEGGAADDDKIEERLVPCRVT
ncbi:MAG: hypothetical protein MO846_02845 [Candidatus Devosia symbiotica]|nr:hypothetical protein [Candidatus Devosia symbiotica]